MADNDNKWKTLLNVGGGIAGALGGWKLGENFGTAGKVIGGVGLCLVGANLGNIVKEVKDDFTSAQDYASAAEAKGVDGEYGKALWNNLLKFGGQAYNAAKASEIEVDSELEL